MKPLASIVMRTPTLFVVLAALLLPPTTSAQSLIYELSPPDGPDSNYGSFAAAVPDVDGDGLKDLLVSGRNKTYLYSGATGTPLYTLQEPLGRLAGIPDVDGDGRGDFLIARIADDGGAGRVYVYSGATGALLYEVSSPNSQSGGRFGNATAGVSDADGDGRGDFLVGAPDEMTADRPDDVGRVYVFSGATGALIRTLLSRDEREEGRFGFSVSGIPDTNGDGIEDHVACAPSEETPDGRSGARRGRCYLFDSATGALLQEYISPNPMISGAFSHGSGVPDADGDGYGDLAVSGLSDGKGYGLGPGDAYLFSGATGELLHILSVPEVSVSGARVTGLSDVDGDGRGDLLLGNSNSAPYSLNNRGMAYLFSGRTGLPLRRILSPNFDVESFFFGDAYLDMDDVDGDGYSDFVIASDNYEQRAYLFSGLPPATLEVTPWGFVTIDAGSTLVFDYTITNNSDLPLTGTIEARMLDDGELVADLGPVISGTLDAGASHTGVIEQFVPVGTEPGWYAYALTAKRSDGEVLDDRDVPVRVYAAGRAAHSDVQWPTPVTEASFSNVDIRAAGKVRAAGEGTVSVYPNPFVQHTTLSLRLDATTDARLVVYDVRGREVGTLADETLAPGLHTFAFDGATLPSGMYIWQLVAEGEVQTGRLTLLR